MATFTAELAFPPQKKGLVHRRALLILLKCLIDRMTSKTPSTLWGGAKLKPPLTMVIPCASFLSGNPYSGLLGRVRRKTLGILMLNLRRFRAKWVAK
jgi:hypothetical protein